MIRRIGFTFIEVIAAMVAASVLLVSLLATVSIATSMLEPTENSSALWADRDIADRISADLRYATSIDSSVTESFTIVRPDASSGALETVTYESYMDGLTRRVGSGTIVELDPVAASYSFNVDGFSGATVTTATLHPQIRGVRKVASTGAVTSIEFELPVGIKHGDLLFVAIAFRADFGPTLSGSGWNTDQTLSNGTLGLWTFYQTHHSGISQTITADLGLVPGEIAIVALAIENANSYSPIVGSTYATGTADPAHYSTHPTPIHTGSVAETDFNLQLIVCGGSPFLDSTLGLSSFTDAAQIVAGEGTVGETSLGVTSRLGPVPSTGHTPRVWFLQSANWLQIGLRVVGPDV